MNIKITLLLFLALLSVSTSPIVGRWLEGVSAISISFWRMFIGALALWLFSIIKNQGSMKLKQNLYRTIIAGVFLGFHFMLFFILLFIFIYLSHLQIIVIFTYFHYLLLFVQYLIIYMCYV